jgi:DNA-binding protein H-NS
MSTQNKDLSELSFAELKQQREAIENIMEEKKRLAVEEANKQYHTIAQELGMTPLEIINGTKGNKTKRTKSEAEAKYADPSNPNNTWSGRGKRPIWLNTLIEQGTSLDDLLISK